MEWLFSTDGFVPRKTCGTWTPELIWLHAGSDILIWLAYAAIPIMLLFIARRRGVPFSGLFWLFGAFILACGTGHLIEAIILDHPVYHLAGVVKAFTAIVSWATVVAMIPAAPRILRAFDEMVSRPLPGDDRPSTSPTERTNHYMVAVFAAALALLTRAALDPLLGVHGYPYLFPTLAVVSIAWYAGLWPALITVVLSLVGATYFFLEPRYSFLVESFNDQLSVGLFLFVGVVVAMLGEAQWSASRRADQVYRAVVAKQAELEAEVARRQQAEADLRRNADELAAALAQLDTFVIHAPLGMALLDPELRFLRVNRQWADAYAKPIEQQIGTPLTEAIPEIPPDAVLDLQHVLQTGEPITDRLLRAEPDWEAGKDRVWQTSYYPVRAANGVLLGVGILSREISDTLRSDRDLRASERRFREMVESLPQLVWTCRADGSCDHLSRQWVEYTGQPEAQQLGDGWLAAVHPDDTARLAQAWQAAVTAGTMFEIEFRIRRHDGVYRWFYTRGVPVRDDEGRVDRWFGTNTDIHDRKAAEVALRESEARKSAILESALDCIVTIDRNGRIVEFNPAAERTFGYARGEALGREMESLVVPPFRDGDRRNGLANYLGIGDYRAVGRRLELTALRRDGTEFPIEASITPIPTDGEPLYTGYLRDISDRKRSLAALQESEARFRSLFDQAAVGIQQVAPDGRLLLVNRKMCDLIGYSPEELMDMTLFDLIHPDDRDVDRQLVDRMWAGEISSFHVQKRYICKDGTFLWVQVTSSAVQVPGSSRRYRLTIAQDITDRKRAEEEIAERSRAAALRADVALALSSEGSVREVLQRCAEGLVRRHTVAFARIWTTDEAERVLELQASAGLYTHLNGPHSRIKMGEFKIGRIAQSRQPHLTNDVSQDPNISDPAWAAREGMTAFAGYPLLVEDRVYGVAALFGKAALTPALLDDLGPLMENVAHYLHRKRTIAALRASEERYRILTEAIPQIVWNADASGQITYFNARWLEYTGVMIDGEADRGWLEAMHPDDAGRVDRAWRAFVSRAADRFSEEFRLRHVGNGTYRWFLSVAIPLRRDDGTVDQWIGSMADIHDQKEHAAVLERLVADRTAALSATNAALVQEVDERRKAEELVQATAAELRRSNEELEKFAYVASHDLQEPLRKIQAFGDRLRTRLPPSVTDQAKDYLDRMMSSAGRMRDLINDLLSFSRVATKTQSFGPVDLNAILKAVVADLDGRIMQSQGQVAVGAMPTIEGDPTQLRQLFQNLIGNALKFARPGVPPKVNVSFELTEHFGPEGAASPALPRAFVRLLIADNGIGFEEKYLGRIFEVFQRLHGRHEYEGTGVGLAICRKIVDRHGGEITAHSVPGEGTTFIVTLPVCQPRTGNRHENPQ